VFGHYLRGESERLCRRNTTKPENQYPVTRYRKTELTSLQGACRNTCRRMMVVAGAIPSTEPPGKDLGVRIANSGTSATTSCSHNLL